MPFELISSYLHLPAFALVVSRLAGLIMFQPMIGGMSVPMQVRALLVVGLAAVVTPMVPLPTDAAPDVVTLTLGLVSEFGLGVVMGLVVRMCFVGLQMGAQLIAQESGVAFAQIADPSSGIESDMLGVFYTQLAGVVFLIIGGHRVLISGALDSFTSVPLLSGGLEPGPVIELVFAALGSGCELALKVAAPVLVTLLLVNVGLGFIARTLPQLNVVTVGFSIKGILAFLLVAVSLPIGIDAFTAMLANVVDGYEALIGG
jgi:flagellar biosynthetic protein FliR